ncbi:NHL repeat-containing protein [Reichenbachiella carrageenanivorans]|uniref:NHL repeat-containing protein n=1 Tax=Reichenbachiella carrageenanivorans TaxID=2979869 RepID=A0ABY6D4A7_9BACT|nr:NHL repeat-containing protein [Reichenbachiella carrageenanivorans]UXX80980.1 NHL repeat-containing protein [Reichenbachiella carrageenanivorans]
MAKMRITVSDLLVAVWGGLLGVACAPQKYVQHYEFTTIVGAKGGYIDGSLSEARMRSPEGIAVDQYGSLYVTEYRNNMVRKITNDGQVLTLAGKYDHVGAVDGKGEEALFNRPHGLAVARDGTVYVCDMHNHAIRKIRTDGIVSTYAGQMGQSGDADGYRLSARFLKPEAIVIDSEDNIYIADTYNFTIRKIATDGQVTTIAGKAGEAGSSDGPGQEARFNMPMGLAIDGIGSLYVADANYDGEEPGNCTIRKISVGGAVTTIAGRIRKAGHLDGNGLQAEFNRPVGIAVTKEGVVFIADTEADLIRKIDQNGQVSTIGGSYLVEGFQNGIGSEARFKDPQSITVDDQGNLFIADTFNHRIRHGKPVFGTK